MTRSKPAQARCPQCDTVAEKGPDNPWRPFCSRRCKLIDLEGWFAERHVIPGEDVEGAAPDDHGEHWH